MATNSAVASSTLSSPVTVLRIFSPPTLPSASTTESTTVSVRNSIFSLSRARSSMILEARKFSERWIRVTLEPNLVRKVASSMAESPPPTTAMCWSLKKKPSQVAQVDTPRPVSSASPGMPRWRGAAPVARMTARAWKTSPSTTTFLMSPEKSTESTSSWRRSAPNFSAWARMFAMRSGPMMPSSKPGKFSTSVVFISSPPYS